MRERQREIEREKGANKSSWESERVREGAKEELRQNDRERDRKNMSSFGWQRFVGSVNCLVSFAKGHCFCRALLEEKNSK